MKFFVSILFAVALFSSCSKNSDTSADTVDVESDGSDVALAEDATPVADAALDTTAVDAAVDATDATATDAK